MELKHLNAAAEHQGVGRSSSHISASTGIDNTETYLPDTRERYMAMNYHPTHATNPHASTSPTYTFISNMFQDKWSFWGVLGLQFI